METRTVQTAAFQINNCCSLCLPLRLHTTAKAVSEAEYAGYTAVKKGPPSTQVEFVFRTFHLKKVMIFPFCIFFLNCVLSYVVLFSQRPNNLAFPVALYQNIIIISCPLLLFPFAILFLVPHWSRMKLNSPPNLWKCVKVNIGILIFPHCSSF